MSPMKTRLGMFCRSKDVEAAFPTPPAPGDFAHWASQVPSFGWTDGVGKEASLATREGHCLGSAVPWVVRCGHPKNHRAMWVRWLIEVDVNCWWFFKMLNLRCKEICSVDTFIFIWFALRLGHTDIAGDAMPPSGWNWKVGSYQAVGAVDLYLAGGERDAEFKCCSETLQERNAYVFHDVGKMDGFSSIITWYDDMDCSVER